MSVAWENLLQNASLLPKFLKGDTLGLCDALDVVSGDALVVFGGSVKLLLVYSTDRRLPGVYCAVLYEGCSKSSRPDHEGA